MTNEEAVQTLYPHDVNAARLLRALSLLTRAVGLKYGSSCQEIGWRNRFFASVDCEANELCWLLVAHGLMECAEARTEKANRKAVM